MSGADRLERLIAAVERQSAPADTPTLSALVKVCYAAREALRGSGSGISVMGPDGWRGIVAASDPLSEQMEDLEFVCGEGPCIDAFTSGRPVLVDDLEDRVWAEWIGYAPLAQQAGVHAVFAFPLQIGAARIGVLDVYRNAPGPLSPDELADALVLADIAMSMLVDLQESSSGRSAELEPAFDFRVYQAQGMVSVQLAVDLVEALARIRAFALAHDRRLSEVASAVLDGVLHLGEEHA